MRFLKWLSFKEVVGNKMGQIDILSLLGIGLAKNIFFDKPKEKRQRKLRAAEIRLSPFTRRGPTTQIQEADLAGTLAQFGGTGLALQAGREARKGQEALQKAQIKSLEREDALSTFIKLVLKQQGTPTAAELTPRIPPGPGATPQLTEEERIIREMQQLGITGGLR